MNKWKKKNQYFNLFSCPGGKLILWYFEIRLPKTYCVSDCEQVRAPGSALIYCPPGGGAEEKGTGGMWLQLVLWCKTRAGATMLET